MSEPESAWECACAAATPLNGGWCGPHHVDGYLVTGYHEACSRYLDRRVQSCGDHPNFDWLEDMIRRDTDESWGPASPHALPKHRT